MTPDQSARAAVSGTRAPFPTVATVALIAALLLAACGAEKAAPGAPGTPGTPGGGMPPPPPVGVVTVAPQTVALQTELPGRVEAQRTAQVRARVTGVVLQRQFREGSEVRAGAPLFLIDPLPYQAALDSALAQQARAEAALGQARATAERFKPLAEAQAISRQDYANAQAAQLAAEADLAAGKAAVQTARISLGYTRVTAPISGRIGRALVTEGALVSAAEATQMALVQQTSSVYVNFTQSSGELLALRRAMADHRVRKTGNGNGNGAGGGGDAVAVSVVLEDGSVLPQPGRLLFSDLSVDATTGQVTLRAEVPNKEGLLLPGQYVRVRLSQAELPAAVLLPQQAVTRTQQGDSVLVVGEGNKPGPRQVKIRQGQDGQWVVTEGLKAGDRVIVDGFQKMFVPGAPVTPVPWTPVGTKAASASATASAPAAAASK